jgi:hypothetical protein
MPPRAKPKPAAKPRPPAAGRTALELLEYDQKLAIVSGLREPMLTQAETLAARGIFP